MSIDADLKNIHLWAKDKIKAGQEPPWAWYQYMKLIETLETIIESRATIQTDCSPQSDQLQATDLQLVDSKYQQDKPQRRREDVTPQMPM